MDPKELNLLAHTYERMKDVDICARLTLGELSAMGSFLAGKAAEPGMRASGELGAPVFYQRYAELTAERFEDLKANRDAVGALQFCEDVREMCQKTLRANREPGE